MNDKKTVLWAAAHDMTAEQKAELEGRNIVLLKEHDADLYWRLTNIKPDDRVIRLAYALLKCGADLGCADIYQPAGSPRFQKALAQVQQQESSEFGKQVCETYFADSIRDSVDQVQPDGSVRKVAVFRHLGFQC